MISILIAGDYCPRYRVQALFDREDYSSVLSEVKAVVEKSDYSIVNLECPVSTNDSKPISKQGPNLKTNFNGLKGVQYAGFDCVTLANNHFYDFGENGVNNTLEALDELKIEYCGGGKNIAQASQIFFKEINGDCLAIINCCEHEFSIAQQDKGGSNPFNPIQQFYAITEARKIADYVLVIVHGGHELYQLPSPRMQEIYRFFVDAGADAVVNHHQHCFSGYETYVGKPIFYGLGNFMFDSVPIKIDDIWNYGYMVVLHFEKDKVDYALQPYLQCGSDATVRMLEKNAFDPKLSELNEIIANEKSLRKATEEFYDLTCQSSGRILEPLFNRYYLAAINRGLMPSLVSKDRKLCAENVICCESHRDKLIYFLNKSLKQ